MSRIEPGWYADPAEPTTQRYWDGEGWIGDPLPIDAQPPPGPPAPATPQPPPEAPGTAPGPAPGGATPWTTTEPTAGAAPPPSPGPTAQPPTGAAPPGAWGPPGGWGPPGSTAPPGTWPPPGNPPGAPPGWPYPSPYPVPVPAPRPHGMPLAASGARLLARLIDIFVVLLLNVVVNGWFVYEYVREVSPIYREWSRRLTEGEGSGLPAFPERATNLQIVIVLLAAALWFAYEVPAVANTGQTIGKRLLGIRVIRLDNPQRLGFGRSFRRWNTMGLPTLLWSCCGIGFLLQFIDALFVAFDRPLHQALHDKSALTVVVDVRTEPGEDGPANQSHDTPGGKL